MCGSPVYLYRVFILGKGFLVLNTRIAIAEDYLTEICFVSCYYGIYSNFWLYMFRPCSKLELPTISDHLSDDGKDFVWQCLQRNPLHRPTAAKLLEHRFIKNASPMEKPVVGHEPSDPPPGITNEVKSMEGVHAKNRPTLNSDRLAIHSSRVSKSGFNSSDIHILRNISCPVSPIGSPLLQSRSPQQLNGRMSPSPISSPRTTSGSSTPLTGTSGAIPFHNLNYSVYLQELPKPLHRPCKNGNTYRDPNPEGCNQGLSL